MISSNNIFERIQQYGNKQALQSGEKYLSYCELDSGLQQIASGLLGDRVTLAEEQIACFIPASLDCV